MNPEQEQLHKLLGELVHHMNNFNLKEIAPAYEAFVAACKALTPETKVPSETFDLLGPEASVAALMVLVNQAMEIYSGALERISKLSSNLTSQN